MKLVLNIFLVIVFISAHITEVKAEPSVEAIAGVASSAAVTAALWNGPPLAASEGMCSGGNAAACVAAVATGLQIVALFVTADGADDSREAAECTGAFCGGPEAPPGDGPGIPVGTTPPTTTEPLSVRSPTIRQLLTNTQALLDRSKENGFESNKEDGSITLPDGRRVTGADLSSVAAGTAAGFSADDMKALESIKNITASDKDRINKLLNQIAGELEASGGGRGRKQNANRDGRDREGLDYAKMFAGLNNKNKNGGSRGLAGLEKKFGSDSIGVAQDNIFLMIHRRYNVKQPTLSP